MKKILVLIIGIVIAVGIAGYFLINSKGYRAYDECVDATDLPCKHYFVGDVGQEWRPSPYRSKEKCETSDGFVCVVPPGDFREVRWINTVDLENELGKVGGENT